MQRKTYTLSEKAVKITYSCDVFASVTQTWHAVIDTLACGCYNSINDIKKVITQKIKKLCITKLLAIVDGMKY